MEVRPFRLGDYAGATRLMEKALSEVCYTETLEAFARQLSWDSRLVLVALEGEDVIGLVIGTIDHEVGYCYRLAVEPSRRREGIGSALVSELQRRFAERNVSRVLVPLDIHNEAALPMYRSLGFGTDSFAKPAKKLSIAAGGV